MEELAVLSEKLGLSIEYLWPRLVAETVFQGWVSLAFGLFCALVVAAIWVKLWRDREDFDEGHFTAGLLSLLGLLFTLVGCGYGITYLLYPEASTIHRLFGG